MTQPRTFSSRSAWKQAYSRRVNGYLKSGDRFIETDPHEAPSHIRRPYSASQWLALPVEERRAQHRKNAEETIKAELGPMPAPASAPRRRMLTLSALEALVIERADAHAADLRYILNGDAEHVEAIVAGQLPAFRARVFDELTRKFAIIEG